MYLETAPQKQGKNSAYTGLINGSNVQFEGPATATLILDVAAATQGPDPGTTTTPAGGAGSPNATPPARPGGSNTTPTGGAGDPNTTTGAGKDSPNATPTTGTDTSTASSSPTNKPNSARRTPASGPAQARKPSRAGPGLDQAEPSPTQGFGGPRARA
ncbi:hypothetical protein B0H17DRAFT_1133954 [Mycena rosella]|uniref:Uncharacterized protein n=1 Tax=Mycena rosella TaxID=1033263 RepID=A0AAD7GHJ6_MYCRO|nr:hypothetical protein B0H17DRAFT_1133954 [Mycena rosella]